MMGEPSTQQRRDGQEKIAKTFETRHGREIVDYNNLTYLNSICTNMETWNKRLKLYTGDSVVNLSRLDKNTLDLLSLGLSFCPTPKKTIKLQS